MNTVTLHGGPIDGLQYLVGPNRGLSCPWVRDPRGDFAELLRERMLANPQLRVPTYGSAVYRVDGAGLWSFDLAASFDGGLCLKCLGPVEAKGHLAMCLDCGDTRRLSDHCAAWGVDENLKPLGARP